MNGFPPPILVETWLHIVKSKDRSITRQQVVSKIKINQYFGSIELAKLYIEQHKDEEIESHFI
jgi:hypothetical protein